MKFCGKEGINLNAKTPFFSINKAKDWEKGIAYNLMNQLAGFGINRDEKYGISGSIELNRLEGIGTVNEIAVGDHDALYLLDDRADLWRFDRRIEDHKRVFSQGHGLFGQDCNLSVSGEVLFVSHGIDERTLAAYHIGNGQTLWSRQGNYADGHLLHPLAITSDANFVYVLTPMELERIDDELVVPEGAKLGIMQFTHGGSLVAIWQDASFHQRVRVKLRHLLKTYYMTKSAAGVLVILDTLFTKLYAFAGKNHLLFQRDIPEMPYGGMCADHDGKIYIGDARPSSQDDEDERFLTKLDAEGLNRSSITSYRGKCDQLLMDEADMLHIFNREQATVTILNLQPQTLLMPETGVPEGVWISQAFDSAEIDTVWHKITSEGFIPDGSQLKISFFSRNETHAIVAGSYRHIDDYIMDRSIPYHEKIAGLSTFWSTAIINPADSLLRGATGRYLWLKLEWHGTERYTPLLEKVRIYFPRETYLSYLPAVYQEDDESRDFLERYLSLFGTLFTELEDQIDGFSRYMDPQQTTGEHLRWLATWVGLDTDDNWQDEQVRAFIQATPELYRNRGTREGLLKTIEIYTGIRPFIVEYFQTKQMRDHAELRSLSEGLYSDDPYTFTVLLLPEQVPTDKQRVVIEQLLEEQKPAYTEAKIVMLQPWMYLDKHTYLGINTTLTEPSLFMIDTERSMPNDTLIVDVGMEKRMDVHTRLEMDSELD